MTVGDKTVRGDIFWIILDGVAEEVVLSWINTSASTVELASKLKKWHRFIVLTHTTPAYESEREAYQELAKLTEEQISHLQRQLEIINQKLERMGL